MANLFIKSLKCIKKQSTLGPDLVYMFVNNVPSGPFRMGKNDYAEVGGRFSFTGTAKIVLIESDSGWGANPDRLGDVTVNATTRDTNVTGVFDELKGAYYEMKYDVTD